MSSTPLRLFGTVTDSIVDGPGLRYSVFVQGCSHACPGCHNPQSWPHDGGTLTTVADVFAEIGANRLVHDVTITGGEPFDQADACAELAELLKANGYGVWTYTGYLFEDLVRNPDPAVHRLLENTDVLVDGPFVLAKKSLSLDWRGSSNQRVIDVPASRRAARTIEWKAPTIELRKPENW